MVIGDRHVLIIEQKPLILKALNVLSTGVESQGSEVSGIFKRLEEFAKDDCGRLVLNLRVMEDALGELPANIRNLQASLVGGVLVVTCRVTTREMLQIKEPSHRYFFPRHVFSRLRHPLKRLFERFGWQGRYVHALKTLAHRVLHPPLR